MNEKIIDKKIFNTELEKTNINNILNDFIKDKNIPNILLYGEHGSGKKTILKNFINNIYNNHDNIEIKNYVLKIDCIFGKGIQFIREELTFFLKSVIKIKNELSFKSVILLNAEYLTIDAQSALRRLIELYSHSTRFFIIVNKLNGIINPILSRFCIFYVNYPEINNKYSNLYLINKINIPKKFVQNKNLLIKRTINKIINTNTTNNNNTNNNTNNNIYINLVETVDKLYYKGINTLDIINYVNKNIIENNKIEICYLFEKIRINIKNEKIIMLLILNKLINILNQ